MTLILAAWAVPPAFAQPAPVRRAVVPADAAPPAMAGLFADLRRGEQTISIPGAAWLQLQFWGVQLGRDGTLTIMSAAGDSQSFSQAELEAWSGLTAVLKGSELRVTLTPGRGATRPVMARIADIIIGLPAAKQEDAKGAPQPLIDLFGGDLDRFIPEDVRRPTTKGVAPEENGPQEAICGTTDDRVASNNPRSGRIMPAGCTGWLIDGGALLTAGHCTGTSMQTVEFNVPASQADGTTVSPPVRDQYRVNAGSIVTQDTGIGNDWAVFRVLPNTETGLLPAAAQGATFQLSNAQNPANVRITGFGVDGPPPNFGAGGSYDATNQTQQTHAGTLSTNTGGANSGTLHYNADTQGGNSGSPVIVEGGNVAIGIHTHGGCTSTGGTNAGTSFGNQTLWTAIGTIPPEPGWHAWVSRGGNLTSFPECEPTGSGTACFVRSATGTLAWNSSADGNTWSGWADLGGSVESAPECLVRGSRIDCFVTTTGKRLAQRTYDGIVWGAWADRGGAVVDRPSCVPASSGAGLDCFARGTNNALWRRQFDGTSWRAWQSVGGSAAMRPECVRRGTAIHCFVVDGSKNLKTRRLSGGTWNAWSQLGTGFGSPPQCVAFTGTNGATNLDCFAQGSGNRLVKEWYNGTSWSGWVNVGGNTYGPLAAQPHCSRSPSSERLDCYWTTTGGVLARRQRNAAKVWQAEENLGGSIQQRPTCLARNDGARVDCLARGTGNTLQQRSYY